MEKLTVPKDEKEVKELQDALDSIVNSFNEYKDKVKTLDKQLDTAVALADTLQIAVDNMAGIIKNVHICLSANNNAFTGNVQLEEMQKELSKFVLGSEAMRAGVRTNANSTVQ